MRENFDKKIVVRWVGGLGNQIFQLGAGLLYAQKLKYGVADLDYEFSFGSFEKSNLKLIFGYVQNHHSCLDSATPNFLHFSDDK